MYDSSSLFIKVRDDSMEALALQIGCCLGWSR